MPLYMDIHEVPGVKPEDVANAHRGDMQVQSSLGVVYHKYWLNEAAGKIYCLCTAPNIAAAEEVHRKAHGLIADRIIEVTPELAEAFMGNAEVNDDGAAVISGSSANERDPGIRTILFTDIVDSTALTQRLGDELAMEIIAEHDRVVRGALAEQMGREVKHTGDGIMAAFLSSVSAIRCGIQIQRELEAYSENHQAHRLHVRIGIAVGEPVERNNDLFGSTVQLAARLCAHAQAAQILVSNAVTELCLGKSLDFQDMGEILPKGFERPIHVHAVSWR